MQLLYYKSYIIFFYKLNINHKCNFYYYIKNMKQSFSMADKKKIITDIITQAGIQAEKPERKSQIMTCLQLANPGEQATSINFLKDRLADWIIANYIQLKANTHIFLQYGNLKYLSKESRDALYNIFKTCQEKIGDSIDYNDIFHGILLKNPYLSYQHMGYMYPPYMMPPGYTSDRQNYQNYGMDMQNYYMQMSKYSGYPVNQLFMPPLMPMPKYSGPQSAQSVIKPSYYNYPNPQIPPNSAPPFSQAQSAQKQQKTQPPASQKPKLNQSSSLKPNKQHNSMRQTQEKELNLKKRQRSGRQSSKNNPFQIIPPHMCKTVREQIPQRIPGLSLGSYQNSVVLNQTNNLIQNIDLQSPEIMQISKHDIPNEQNKTNAKQKKTILNSYTSQLVGNLASAIKNFSDQERQKKFMAQNNQKVNIQIGQTFYQDLKNCACRGYGVYQQIYTCSQCSKKYHYYCTSKKQIPKKAQNSQICHFCFMRNIDPLNKVQIQVKTLYIMDIRHNKISENIDFEVYDHYISKNSPYQIEVRSMKLQDASNLVPEYTWPDQCLVMLNQQKTIQFQALQHNSSLKKRKDMSIFLTSYIYHYNKNYTQRKNLPIGLEIKQNTIMEMNQKKIKNNFIFLFGIYLIKKKTPDELCQQIMKNPDNKVNFAQKYFSQPSDEDQIQIQQIKVNLMDPFTWNLIDIPVRGIKCTHGQCFDLKTFLSFMNVQKVRQWKCPVCNKQCRNFNVDTKQLQVIKQFKKQQTEGSNKKLSRQISFHRNGTTLFVMQNDDQEQQDEDKNENSAEPLKTKIISKDEKQSK